MAGHAVKISALSSELGGADAMLDEMRALSRQQAGERQHLHQQVAALTDALQRSQAEVAELQHLQQSAAQQAAESAAEVRRLGGAVQQATASSAAELRAQEEQGAALREETRKRQVASFRSLLL